MRKIATILAAGAVLVGVMAGTVSAAPNGISFAGSSCTVDHLPGGTYATYIHLSAVAPSGDNWLFNGVYSTARTMGYTQPYAVTNGTEWFQPTTRFDRDWRIPEYAKSVYFALYNGSALKGSTTVTCQLLHR